MSRHASKGVHSLIVSGLLLTMPTLAVSQNLYRVTDLGALIAGGRTSAHDINDSGQVVGWSHSGFGERAFLWTSEAGMRNIGQPAAEENMDSIALGINNRGKVVGYSIPSQGSPRHRRAFVWSSVDQLQELDEVSDVSRDSEAASINEAGEIVGFTHDWDGHTNYDSRPILWATTGDPEELGPLPGGTGEGVALDINDRGEVVGESRVGFGGTAFFWSRATGMVDLGTGDFSSATAINENGQIVGSMQGGRAFLWTNDGIQDLGDLPGGPVNGNTAFDINDHGDVVGVADYPLPGRTIRHAFLWTQTDGMRDLNNMLNISGTGWTLVTATAINNAGQIVGYGINPSGLERGFLLSPLPAPVLFAFTEFNDPPVGSTAFNPGPADEEVGFTTAISSAGGLNPLAGVAVVGETGGTRALSHRSVNATTTIELIDLNNYEEVGVSFRMQVANTTYEAGDFVRVYATNDMDSIDLVSLSANSGTDGIDDLAGDGFLRYSAFIPNDWTQVRLVITSSTNSTQGAERFDFDSIEFRGVAVIPEPSTRGLVIAAVAAVVARRLRFGMNCPGRGGSLRGR